MQHKWFIENAILIYFLFLLLVVILKMRSNVNFIDIMYFVSVLCGIIKYLLIRRECGK